MSRVAPTSAVSPPRLRALYRQLLSHAHRFPSVKRAAIVSDIRDGASAIRGARTLPRDAAYCAELQAHTATTPGL
jgi:hypothetical protein